MDEPVKKKRGRKPKSQTQPTDPNAPPAEPKVKKKRGRKVKWSTLNICYNMIKSDSILVLFLI